MGGVGERKEGGERRGGGEGGAGEGKNNPVTFLLLRRSCLLFRMMKPTRHYNQRQQIHLAAQPRLILRSSVRQIILFTLVRCFSQQEHHTQRLDIL